MVKIAADTVDDFVEKSAKIFGKNKLGETEHSAAYKFGGFKDGKIAKLSFSCPIKVSYAEVGAGKPDAANKKAIAEVAALTKEHEINHKKYYEKAFAAWNPKKVEKELMADDYADRKAAESAMADKFADLMSTLLDACLDLHKKEGLIDVDTKADGSIKVTSKPAGATGCK